MLKACIKEQVVFDLFVEFCENLVLNQRKQTILHMIPYNMFEADPNVKIKHVYL